MSVPIVADVLGHHVTTAKLAAVYFVQKWVVDPQLQVHLRTPRRLRRGTKELVDQIAQMCATQAERLSRGDPVLCGCQGGQDRQKEPGSVHDDLAFASLDFLTPVS